MMLHHTEHDSKGKCSKAKYTSNIPKTFYYVKKQKAPTFVRACISVLILVQQFALFDWVNTVDSRGITLLCVFMTREPQPLTS